MDLQRWFAGQLASSGDTFIWAIAQVREERRDAPPPPTIGVGEWPAARHAYHLLHYESHIALPVMRQWAGGPTVTSAQVPSEERAWSAGRPDLVEVARALREVREREIALIGELAADEVWRRGREALWGVVPLSWVVTKTIQHTAEHTHSVLSIALFWP